VAFTTYWALNRASVLPYQRFRRPARTLAANPLRIEIYNDKQFGFLRMTISPKSISGVFVTVEPGTGKTGSGDSFTVDLKSNQVSAGATATKIAPAFKKAGNKKATEKNVNPPRAASADNVKPAGFPAQVCRNGNGQNNVIPRRSWRILSDEQWQCSSRYLQCHVRPLHNH
jgi:hypothetical protein